MKELDFNIGKSRTEFIGELVNASTNAFIYAKVRPKEKYLFKYFGYLEALNMELKTYIKQEKESSKKADSDEESDTKSVDQVLEEIGDDLNEHGFRPDGDSYVYDDEDYTDVLNKMKTVQEKLSKIRADIGLDIPSSSKIDPESAGIEGL